MDQPIVLVRVVSECYILEISQIDNETMRTELRDAKYLKNVVVRYHGRRCFPIEPYQRFLVKEDLGEILTNLSKCDTIISVDNQWDSWIEASEFLAEDLSHWAYKRIRQGAVGKRILTATPFRKATLMGYRELLPVSETF